jgi:hypothetical protein
MKAITHPAQAYARPRNSTAVPHFSLSAAWHKLIAYAESQQEKRLLWSAISVLGHGTIFTIATFATVILTGNDFYLLAATCLTMSMVLVVNLAALPTKYTIPIFFFSLLTDIIIMVTALGLWLN